MDPHGSGDHHQVQAAADRAVGGGPPSSATVSASAAALSLPPTAPSATDPAPASDAAAAAPSTREQIAAASIENVHQGADDNDGQTASTHGEMTAVIEELMNAPLRVNELPLPQPPALTAARYDQMEEDIKALRAISPNVSEVPIPMARMAADLSDMDQAIKENAKNASNSGSGMDPPLPSSQMAAFAEEMVEDDEECGSKKKAAPTTEADNDAPPASVLLGPPTAEEDETLQRVQDPPTLAVARAPSPPPTDQGRSASNPRGQQQIPVRPPPPSMMLPNEDPSAPSVQVADVQVASVPRDPSAPMLEGTLAPEIPIYDGVPVPEQTWMKKNKKHMFGGLGLLFGGAVVTGVFVSANNDSSGSDAIESQGVVASTGRPSESSSPSEVPSLRRTFGPSRSLAPSDVPSLRPTLGPSQSRSLAPSTSLRPTSSLRPSQTPSLHPSWMPTATPPVYCGKINILTDEHPEDINWNLVRFDTISGISHTNEVVLEGSPDEEGLRTYEACLEGGDYEFAVFDGNGYEISSPGYYSVTFDGAVIAQGGEFESEERVSFSLRPCHDNRRCGTDGYCNFDWGCSGRHSAGVCAPTEDLNCPDGNTVCGCDGEDYDSACHAQAEGVNVDHYGPCTRFTRPSSKSSPTSSSSDDVRDSIEPIPSPQPSESSQPSESPPPSQFPSASFQPSESSSPSQFPSASFQPSESSSPSQFPSASFRCIIDTGTSQDSSQDGNHNLVCPGKIDDDYCDGTRDCENSDFCDCQAAQDFCNKGINPCDDPNAIIESSNSSSLSLFDDDNDDDSSSSSSFDGNDDSSSLDGNDGNDDLSLLDGNDSNDDSSSLDGNDDGDP